VYPRAELTELEERKRALRRRITLRRGQVARDARRAGQPLRTLDQIYAQWRRISPLAKLVAVPLGLWLKRKLFRRRISGLLLRWMPLLVGALMRR